MSSPILEALPALHVTVIGVVAAFFSAFAIYAYQKVNDAKEKLEQAINISKSVSTPENMLIKGENDYLKPDGSLDWKQSCKDTLYKATELSSYLEEEKNYGVKRSSMQQKPSSEDVISTCNEMFSLLTTIFTTFPFWSNHFTEGMRGTDKVKKLCSKDLDDQRIQQMQTIVVHLNMTWNRNKHSLMTLAEYGTEFNREKILKEQKEKYEKFRQSMEKHIGPIEQERVWQAGYQVFVDSAPEFRGVFTSFFKKSEVIEKEVIPLLFYSLSTFKTYNETFKVKETTLKVILLIVFNMWFGVILPLVTLDLITGVNFETDKVWFIVFEYFVLFSTMLPYLWACNFLYNKVKNLSFA